MAKSQSLNIVIGADIQNLKKGFDAAVVAVQKSGKMLTDDAGKTVAGIQAQFDKLASGKLTGRTVQQLTNMAMEVRALGPEFANTANQMIREAGKIKDSIGDARAEVGYFASDTRKLDAVLGSIQGVAGAFGVVEGSMAALGLENDDLQKTMVKLQGVIAVVNGLQAVQNTLQAESAAMVGLQTAAAKIQTFVMGQATVAARAYNAALLATGAGVILAGLAAVYTHISNNADAAEKAEEAQRKHTTSLEEYNSRAIHYVDKKLRFDEQVAIKQAQIAGATTAEIERIELQYLNKRLVAYKKMYEQVGIDSKESAGLYQQISDIEREITLKTLDVKITASNAARVAHQAEIAARIEAEDKASQKIREIRLGEGVSGTKPQGIKAVEVAQPKPIDPKPIEHAYARIDYAAQNAAEKQEEYEQRFVKATEGINQAFNSLTAQGLEAFGELVGGVLTGQIDSFETFGKQLLKAVAGFMKSFGQALIATATASKAFKELLIKNPIAAAAAGVALVAGSAVITSMLNKGPNVTAFADGGIVSGPTLGLMGEYPGARTNPEVIAPLDKLKALIKPSDSTGYIASTHVSGRDLAIVLNRYNKDNQRG